MWRKAVKVNANIGLCFLCLTVICAAVSLAMPYWQVEEGYSEGLWQACGHKSNSDCELIKTNNYTEPGVFIKSNEKSREMMKWLQAIRVLYVAAAFTLLVSIFIGAVFSCGNQSMKRNGCWSIIILLISLSVIGILVSLLVYEKKVVQTMDKGWTFYVGIAAGIAGIIADFFYIATISLSCIYLDK